MRNQDTPWWRLIEAYIAADRAAVLGFPALLIEGLSEKQALECAGELYFRPHFKQGTSAL